MVEGFSECSLFSFHFFLFFFFCLIFVGERVTVRQDYFIHFEPSQSVGGAKTADPREKPPDHPKKLVEELLQTIFDRSSRKGLS